MAVPVNCRTAGSMAVGLLMPVFGARFPLMTARPPEAAKGSSILFITSLFSANRYAKASTFSFIVLPVQVITSM